VATALRGQLHLQLGIAGLLSASAESIEYLALALETLTETAERTVATHLLSLAYQHHDRHRESAELIERELALHPDRPGEEILILRASQVGALLLSGLHEEDAESLGLNEPEPALTGQTPAERAMLANIAFYRMQAGWDRASVIEPAVRGLAQGLLGDPGATGNIALAIFALLYAEDYTGTADWGRALAETARTKGDLIEIGMGWWFTGLSQGRMGDLPDSEASLLTGYEFVAEVSSPLGALSSVAALLDVRRERGRLAEAEALLRASGLEGDIPLLGPAAAELISSRGQLRLAQGRTEDAVRDLRESQERYAAIHLDDFPGLGWRPGLIEALIRTGDQGGAAELAEHDLSLAEKLGAQTATAVALRNRALATEADQEEQLGRAAEILRDEPARLQRARTNAELGAFLRRAGRRKEARGVLREALDEARQCGAAPLAARCREELEASGARLRRDRVRGIDALTPSELRVVRLAAAGNTNREIAQQLFVSMKTIEKHLGNAYMKLDVSSRNELSGALDAAPQQDSAEGIPLENPSYPAA
jgi:DNA-binding CsgD family transcriptional regulator